jgi:hypothetical protein
MVGELLLTVLFLDLFGGFSAVILPFRLRILHTKYKFGTDNFKDILNSRGYPYFAAEYSWD